jgi:hypothetical protein
MRSARVRSVVARGGRRWVVFVALVSFVVPPAHDVLLRPAGANAGTLPDPTQCAPLQGKVLTPYGYPIEGAAVSVKGAATCTPSVVYSDANGVYRHEVEIGTATETSMTISITGGAEGFRTRTRTVDASAVFMGFYIVPCPTCSLASPKPIPASAVGGSDFILEYDPEVLTPRWTQSGVDVSLAVSSLAPVPTSSDAPGVRAIVDLPASLGSGHIELFAVSAADGWTTWEAETLVAGGLTGDEHRLDYCLVDQAWDGSCAAADGDTIVSSPIEPHHLGVDDAAPVAAPFPHRYATIAGDGDVGAVWSDAQSGLASMELLVDGAPLAVETDGTAVWIETTTLQDGIHMIDLQATDQVGNVATDRFIFTKTTLSASDAAATLVGDELVYEAGALTFEETIRFQSPAVAVDSFRLDLAASSDVGIAAVERPITFGAADVEFTTGPLTSVVTVPVEDTQSNHEFAVLAPSPATLAVDLAPSTLAFDDLVVPLPEEHRAANAASETTVRLLSASTSLGAPLAVDPESLLPSEFEGRVVVVGGVAACAGESDVNCAVDESPRLQAYTPATGFVSIANSVAPPELDRGDERKRPSCVGTAGAGSGCEPDPVFPSAPVFEDFWAQQRLGCGEWTQPDTGEVVNPGLLT